ncbi:MAG: hypothetical protein IJU32_05135 [Pyramidobacter sp.]|nr:hypothetical protein [Pyramidobacter sp.]
MPETVTSSEVLNAPVQQYAIYVKGQYDTLADLQAAHPTGEEGDAYNVGDHLYVWDVVTSAWVSAGEEVSTMSAVLARLQALESVYAKLSGSLADNPITRTNESGHEVGFMQHGNSSGVDPDEICDIGWNHENRDGAVLGLRSASHSTQPGYFELAARYETDTSVLQGSPSVTLKWNGNPIVTIHTTWYKRPSLMTPNKTTVTIPAGMQVAINGGLYITNTATTLNLNSFITAANRKGKDVYVYACVPTSGTQPVFVASLNSTVPSGYTSSNSRKIGGCHCLCADVGTISGHTLSGYVAGDILPASVWDLLFRAEAENEGMVFIGGHWYDIYLPSWASNKLQSVYGGTIVDGASAMPMHGERFAEYAGLVNKRLICRDEFLVIAKGSNECTNIANSADPGTTGGHKDTADRRMISNHGLEDCCGVLWQWTSDIFGTYNNVSSTTFTNQGGINATAQTSEAAGNHYLNGYNWQADGRGTSNIDIDDSASLYGNALGALVRALVGGYWLNGSDCGSRSVHLYHLSSVRAGNFSGRLASEPRVVNL